MATQSVIIEINEATGELHIEVNGVKGGKCKDITKALTQLGPTVAQSNTCELYEQELPDVLQQEIRGG